MSGFTNYHNMVLVGSTRVPPKYLLYGLGKRPRNEKSPKNIIIFNILGAINSATSRWSSEIEHAHHYTKVITNLGDYIDLVTNDLVLLICDLPIFNNELSQHFISDSRNLPMD